MSEEIYRPKRHLKIWPAALWARWAIMILISLFFISGMIYAIEKGSSRKIVSLMLKQSFPIEAIILEGVPGYSQPERERLVDIRQQGLSLGMFLLTGVNISDARTFFLSYYSPPPQGPAWLGWAYYPDDPEFEGPILEPVPEEPDAPEKVPAKPVPNGDKKIRVGIYHTHNSESYAGDGGGERRQGENGDVVEVGKTMKKVLVKEGIGTIQSLTIHDAADFMKAYSESVKTASSLLKDYPTMDVLLDIHRDGIPPGVSKSTALINGKHVSRVLIVIGKKNPHWEKNEEFAKELIALGEKKYPGLFIPSISYAADARYNQHLSEKALLLEFGSQLNTLDEADGAAEAVGEILSDWLKTH